MIDYSHSLAQQSSRRRENACFAGGADLKKTVFHVSKLTVLFTE
jgi:hypothetical protein